MAGALQADAGVVVHAVPLVVGDGDEPLVDQFQVVVHCFGLPAEAEVEGVFEHQGQQPGGGLAAKDRAFETRGQQPGDAAHVVDVHVGHQQGAHGADVEVDGQFVGAAAGAASLPWNRPQSTSRLASGASISWWQEPVTPLTAP